MSRNPALAVILSCAFLIFCGCASVSKVSAPPAQPAPAVQPAQAPHAQISIKMPAKEWLRVVNPQDPAAIAFEHQQTTAFVNVQLFPTTQRPLEDVAGELLTRMSANGIDCDMPVIAADLVVFDLRGALPSGEKFAGRMSVKRMPGREAESSFFALGVWPVKFSEKMAKDYDAIVASVKVVDAP